MVGVGRLGGQWIKRRLWGENSRGSKLVLRTMESNQYTATVYGHIKDGNYIEAVRILQVSPHGSSIPILAFDLGCPLWIAR